MDELASAPKVDSEEQEIGGKRQEEEERRRKTPPCEKLASLCSTSGVILANESSTSTQVLESTGRYPNASPLESLHLGKKN